MNRRLPRSLIALSVLTAFATGGLHAATLTWDASGASPASPTGGAGTWSSTHLNWSNGATDVGWTVSEDNAIFAGTGGTVTLGEAVTVNNLNINSTGYIIAGGGFTLTINGTLTNSQTGTLTAKLGGSNGLTKAGSGTLVLNNASANTYTGNTTIQAGTLQARATGALTASTTVVIGSGSGNATLDVRASQTVAGISKAGTGTSSITNSQTTGTTRITVNPDGAGVAAADSVFSGVIRDGDATHLLALTKAGGNTLTLSGTNSYSGSTIVSGGTLKLGSSLTASAGVTVSGGTLSGNDSPTAITLGAGAVSMSSGAITPGGVGTAGSFTLAADQTFSTTGGTLAFDIGGSFDQILGSGTGTFNLANTTLALSGATSVVGTYSLFSGFASGSITNLTITGLADGFTGSLGLDGLLTITGSSIPEPSAYATLAGVALFGFAAIRRRRA